MLLGKIIQSSDHLEYLCQIYRADEVEHPPTPHDFAFGSFVALDLPGDSQMVGVIYNTQLFNPDFGRLGPRLSPQSDLEVFSPDYLQERATLVSIAALGTLKSDGSSNQSPPTLTPQPDALVHGLNEEQIRNFHLEKGRLQLAYAPLLLSRRLPVIPELLLLILDQLNDLFPDRSRLLSLLRDDLLWRARVTPVGGDV
ncbi:MAG: hypothetical protein PVI81_00015 [Anaerolineales bacterium]|jgi:hypothetical protein